MRQVVTFLMLIGALSFVSAAVAQENDKATDEAKKCPVTSAEGAKCPAGQTVATDDNSSCCAATKEALAKLPKMTYLVGEEKTCCADSAAELAKKSDKPMQFIVGEKTFDDKAVAYTALVESTEKYVANFAKPQTCEKSGTTSVAGKECGCSHEQSAIVRLVKTTMEDVKMTYVVGEKKCECPNEAKALAKNSDAKTEFVVGDKKTSCNLTARLNLAQAKYVAIVNAMAKRAKEAPKGHGTTEDSSTDT